MARRRSKPPGPGPFDYRPLLGAFKRLDPQTQLIVVAVLLLVGIVAAIVSYRAQHPQQTPLAQISFAGNPNMLLGNPSGATPDPANPNNYLMVKKYFALSYNNDAGTLNWVSWRVVQSDLGNAPRQRLFSPDPDLPPGFKRAVHQDYTGGGFDRGHVCPHSDRAATEEMSAATFVMTNIIPQAPNVNEKAWAQLEIYCRQLVRRQQQRLHIIAGPNGKGGRGNQGFRSSLANGKVTVPAECWKVVVVVPEAGGDNDLAKITPSTRVITIRMPNDNAAVGDEWAKYRTSPAEVERRTGLRFFDTLPSDLAQTLRQKIDQVSIPPPQVNAGQYQTDFDCQIALPPELGQVQGPPALCFGCQFTLLH